MTRRASTGVFEKKFGRLRRGGKARVLDLFAGCGGLSLGFHAAGFKIEAAVEFDPEAAKSHGLNFHGGDLLHSAPIDITKTHPADLCSILGLGEVSDAFDVLIGGPPCQAFARVGRPKLREIDQHPEAFKHDPRARLYQEWLRYVEETKPLAVLMENVPDVLNHGGQNIAEEICEVLEEKGYVCGYTLLNAAHYGVPQMRLRMFLVGYRKELKQSVAFPAPTHWIDLPSGYEGSRSVALKLLNEGELYGAAHHYLQSPVPEKSLPEAICAEDAIGDLPEINARELLRSGDLKRGTRRFDIGIPYRKSRSVSKYAMRMREWPDFESDGFLYDHVIRFLPRDFEIFSRMNAGDQYPQAMKHAVSLFEEQLAIARAAGKKVVDGSSDYNILRDRFVPPYDVGKFPNKWRKMWRDQPARTLMAHLGKDSYSHIHYDSNQARTISVREAARLQSFPDGFEFCGTMNPAFRQIGNAVPPLLAFALADQMRLTLQLTNQNSLDVSPRTAAAV